MLFYAFIDYYCLILSRISYQHHHTDTIIVIHYHAMMPDAVSYLCRA